MLYTGLNFIRSNFKPASSIASSTNSSLAMQSSLSWEESSS